MTKLAGFGFVDTNLVTAVHARGDESVQDTVSRDERRHDLSEHGLLDEL